MNALDALFCRQVPTRSPNASSNAGARQQGSGQTESFASALSSGRPDRPEPRARQADDKAPARGETVDDAHEAAASDDRGADPVAARRCGDVVVVRGAVAAWLV